MKQLLILGILGVLLYAGSSAFQINPVEEFPQKIQEVSQEIGTIRYIEAPTIIVSKPAVYGIESTSDIININTVLFLINEKRQSLGLNRVYLSEELTEIAQWKAENMMTHNYMSHIDSNGEWIWQKVYSYKRIGEILARNWTTASSQQIGWENSPKHYKIMTESNYEEVGIGIATNLSGEIFTAVVFKEI